MGDPHYRSYDGQSFDLFDHCSHVFTKDCVNGTFTVISITSDRCSGGRSPTCIEEAVVHVPELNTTVILTGRPLQYSFVGEVPSASKLSVVANNHITVSIFKLGVVVNFGLYYLSVNVPDSYYGKMCGLAGTYDGNRSNDYRLLNGTVVNEPNHDFELAWRVDLPNHGCVHMLPQPPPPCQGAALQEAEAFCNVLQLPTGPFSACHGIISPEIPFKECVLDHCACDGDVCACSVVLNYAERCRAQGIGVGPIPNACSKLCKIPHVCLWYNYYDFALCRN